MTKKMKVLLTAAVVAVTAAAIPDHDLHFGLARSVPAAGSTVAAPTEVTLWFTEVPQDNSISIRLVDARGELVPASDPRQGSEDQRQFSIVPSGALAAGEYPVAWRGIGQDGHTVRGDFGFTVRAE